LAFFDFEVFTLPDSDFVTDLYFLFFSQIHKQSNLDIKDFTCQKNSSDKHFLEVNLSFFREIFWKIFAILV